MLSLHLGPWWRRAGDRFETFSGRVPPRARPYVRLATLMAIALIVDVATGQLAGIAATTSFSLVGTIRILSSIMILQYPLAGFVLSLELDKWDWYWLGMGERSAEVAFYQHWDKVVDLVTFIPAVIVVGRWKDRRARVLACCTLVLRLFGVTAFFVTAQEWLLIAFPNVFEPVFLLYLVFRVVTGRDEMLSSLRSSLLVAVALTVPKIAQEYFLHVLGDRPWTMIHLTQWHMVDVGLWFALLYSVPIIVLIVLGVTSEGPVRRSDPEVQWPRQAGA